MLPPCPPSPPEGPPRGTNFSRRETPLQPFPPFPGFHQNFRFINKHSPYFPSKNDNIEIQHRCKSRNLRVVGQFEPLCLIVTIGVKIQTDPLPTNLRKVIDRVSYSRVWLRGAVILLVLLC